MNLRNLFLLNTFVLLAFALGLLLGPTTVLTLYGMKTGPSESLEAQLLGAALVVPALLTWLAKDWSEGNARRGVVIALFLFYVIGFVVMLLGILSKAMKPAGWSAAIVFLFFALGYGYLQFAKPSEM